MRVLYVDPLGSEGGLGGYSNCLINAYSKCGYEVTVATSDAAKVAGFPEISNVNSIYGAAFTRSRHRILRAIAYLIGCIRTVLLARHHDILVHHLPHIPPLDALTLAVVARLGVRTVIVAHDPRSLRDAPGERWYGTYFRQAELVLVHGQKAHADLLEYGVHPDAVRIARHGDFAPATPVSAQRAHEILGIERSFDGPVVVIVGNLKPGKGIRRVVAALRDTPLPVGTLLIAGKPQNDDEINEFLESHAGEDSRLHLILKRLTVTEEHAVYSLADAVLALYESGYSSGVIATAHAVGRPVVLTEVGDLPIQRGSHDELVRADWSAAELDHALSGIWARRQPSEVGEANPVSRDGLDLEAWREHVLAVTEAFGLKTSPHVT